MRVEPRSIPGTMACDSGTPQMGVVYCVEDFWEGPQFNVVMLVGFGGWRYQCGMPTGWRATYFRKIEEIKLCIAAVKQTSAPVLVNIKMTGAGANKTS